MKLRNYYLLLVLFLSLSCSKNDCSKVICESDLIKFKIQFWDEDLKNNLITNGTISKESISITSNGKDYSSSYEYEAKTGTFVLAKTGEKEGKTTLQFLKNNKPLFKFSTITKAVKDECCSFLENEAVAVTGIRYHLNKAEKLYKIKVPNP